MIMEVGGEGVWGATPGYSIPAASKNCSVIDTPNLLHAHTNN